MPQGPTTALISFLLVAAIAVYTQPAPTNQADRYDPGTLLQLAAETSSDTELNTTEISTEKLQTSAVQSDALPVELLEFNGVAARSVEVAQFAPVASGTGLLNGPLSVLFPCSNEGADCSVNGCPGICINGRCLVD